MGLGEVHGVGRARCVTYRDRHRHRRIVLLCCHAVVSAAVKDVRPAARNQDVPAFECNFPDFQLNRQ